MDQSKLILPFKDRYDLQKRKTMVLTGQKNRPDFVLVVIQKYVGCPLYPQLISNLFFVSKNAKVLSLESQLKKRLKSNAKNQIQNDALFIYTASRIMNKQLQIDAIYQKYQDKQDGILYLKYSGVDPF